jgi:hypothetical protein
MSYSFLKRIDLKGKTLEHNQDLNFVKFDVMISEDGKFARIIDGKTVVNMSKKKLEKKLKDLGATLGKSVDNKKSDQSNAKKDPEEDVYREQLIEQIKEKKLKFKKNMSNEELEAILFESE